MDFDQYNALELERLRDVYRETKPDLSAALERELNTRRDAYMDIEDDGRRDMGDHGPRRPLLKFLSRRS